MLKMMTFPGALIEIMLFVGKVPINTGQVKTIKIIQNLSTMITFPGALIEIIMIFSKVPIDIGHVKTENRDN